ncbi:ribulose phosphate epimerase [Nitratireductor sp. XY-223]|uniref:ribulose phosphate epimerase n=1 Tax=Nitratireductor sp. XY-223 TaxID=2561926 RepID=UPI00145B2FCA|nr:ribulose phosphate epimerase [Nitratireductor sp. XY-223]
MTGNAMESLKERCRGISLGIFAGDPGNLRADAEAAASWGCDILHFDVMDGVFVPQISGGPGFVKALTGNMIRDVHLMVQRPADHVADFVAAGSDIVTVQAESEAPTDALRAIRAASESARRPVLAGLCLMPDTTLDDAGELLAMDPDLVLVAALDPRRKQPADIDRACGRVAELRRRYGPDGPLIQLDGGVTADTIGEIAGVAPDLVVSGSAVMRTADPAAAFRGMKDALD